MCEAVRVVRDTPADEPGRNSVRLEADGAVERIDRVVSRAEELASDHCAVLVKMDFVEEPFRHEKEEVSVHQPLAG